MNYRASDIALFKRLNEQKPVSRPRQLISEYVEEKRVLPSNAPRPGRWSNDWTPYNVEIMDCMSPFSPIQHVVFMKSAQVGATSTAEGVIAYWMDENPSEILYVSSTTDSLSKWGPKRLEPLIDSCGFRHKIFAQTENKNSRRTGDKLFSKEFIGGTLNMASAQSAPSLRSDSIRILIRDEIDSGPATLKSGEGNWLDVSYARTTAWGNRKKVFDFTTPTTYQTSLILPLYELGDQRRYEVPCPFCGVYQFLELGNAATKYGLKAERDPETKELRVFYVCYSCEGEIYNYHKTRMLDAGRWIPTSKSHHPTFRSYHINSLYSPVGMLSWGELYREYIAAEGDVDKMKAFVNLRLGLPFKESGSKPKLSKVLTLIGKYTEGTIPDGVIYLTMGVDVQRGSETDIENPPRLELEVMGMGKGYRTWSILYKVIIGAVKDPYAGAWEELNSWAESGGLIFERSDSREFPVSLIFVDSGDGATTDIVYRFCERWQNTRPIKGYSNIKKTKVGVKQDTVDEAGSSNYLRYKIGKSGETTFYKIATNYYKNAIYNSLDVGRLPSDPQKPGFCDFPSRRGEEYFRMLTVEEKLSDGSFQCPAHARNEALDLRVYARCAADVFLGLKVREYQAIAKTKGATPYQLEAINYKSVLDILGRQVERIDNV